MIASNLFQPRHLPAWNHRGLAPKRHCQAPAGGGAQRWRRCLSREQQQRRRAGGAAAAQSNEPSSSAKSTAEGSQGGAPSSPSPSSSLQLKWKQGRTDSGSGSTTGGAARRRSGSGAAAPPPGNNSGGGGGGGNSSSGSGGGGRDWEDEGRFIAYEDGRMEGAGWDMPARGDAVRALTAAQVYGRGQLSAFASGLPPAGYRRWMGEEHDQEVLQRVAAANDRTKLSDGYRRRLEEAESTARTALAAAEERRPPVPESQLQICRALLDIIQGTVDPDKAEDAVALIQDVADGNGLYLPALGPIMDPSGPVLDYYGLRGEETDRMLEAALKGEDDDEEYLIPQLQEGMAQFVMTLENDWRPIRDLFYNNGPVVDKSVAVAMLRALPKAAEPWEHLGHRAAGELRTFIAELAEHAQQFVGEMAPAELALLSSTLGRFGVLSRLTFTTLQRHTTPKSVLSTLRPPIAVDLLWGMAKAGHRPPTGWIVELGEHVVTTCDGSVADAVAAGRVLYACALLRFKPGRRTLSGAFSATQPVLDCLSPVQIANVIWAAAELDARPPSDWLAAALAALGAAHRAAAAAAAAAGDGVAPLAPRPAPEWWRLGGPGGRGIIDQGLAEPLWGLRRRAHALGLIGTGGTGSFAGRGPVRSHLGPESLGDIACSLIKLLTDYQIAAARDAAAAARRGGGAGSSGGGRGQQGSSRGFSGRGGGRSSGGGGDGDGAEAAGAAAEEADRAAAAVVSYLPDWYQASGWEVQRAEPYELARLIAGAAALIDGGPGLRVALAVLEAPRPVEKGGLPADWNATIGGNDYGSGSSSGGRGGGRGGAAGARGGGGGGGRQGGGSSSSGEMSSSGQRAQPPQLYREGTPPPPPPPAQWVVAVVQAVHAKRTAFGAAAFADFLLSLMAMLERLPEAEALVTPPPPETTLAASAAAAGGGGAAAAAAEGSAGGESPGGSSSSSSAAEAGVPLAAGSSSSGGSSSRPAGLQQDGSSSAGGEGKDALPSLVPLLSDVAATCYWQLGDCRDSMALLHLLTSFAQLRIPLPPDWLQRHEAAAWSALAESADAGAMDAGDAIRYCRVVSAVHAAVGYEAPSREWEGLAIELEEGAEAEAAIAEEEQRRRRR